MPPVDAETPPRLVIYYIMTFYATKDFLIFLFLIFLHLLFFICALRSTTAAKETTDNSHL